MEKWWFLDQNHGLTPLEKCPFFNFLNLFFYSLERRFFVLEYRKGHFPMLYCRKKKRWKNGHFRANTMGYSFWKNVNFSTFRTICFYSLERVFFVLEYPKRHFLGLYWLYFLKGGKGSRVDDLVVKWIKKLRSLKKTGENFLLLFDNTVDGRPGNLLYCKGGIDCFRINVSDQDELISAWHLASL